MTDMERQQFHSIQMADRDWINGKLWESQNASCEYSFANNFIYAGLYDVQQVCELSGCGVIRYREKSKSGQNGQFCYSFPFGSGDKRAALEQMKELCRQDGYGLSLYPVLEQDRKSLIQWFPGEFEIDAHRADFDYIYRAEKLASLRGKKLHGKRNHIARVMDGGDWRYEPMSADNIEGCRKMADEWSAMRADKWNESMEQELSVLGEALKHFFELGFVGGVLYRADKIVAFTIGERLNEDTLVVHFEKAYPDMQGAYPMINRQFVLHEGTDCIYVNREEDTGDLGLRKAKLSYYPDILLKKYRARESRVVFANETDTAAIAELWRVCFGDSPEYIEMYLSNRFETENMLVIHEDGRPVSMLSLLPVLVTVNGEKKAARYVYAVATLPEYRKRGYAAGLIKYAFDKYEEPLILQPADDELRQYYGRLGFQEAFSQSPCWVYNLCAQTLTGDDDYKLQSVSAKEYKEMRDLYFEKEGYVEWDESAIGYAMLENSFCGGETVGSFSREGRVEAVVMYRVCKSRDSAGSLHVIEAALDDAGLWKILPELMRRTDTVTAYAKNEGGMMLRTRETAAWECREGYLNLTLG